MLGILTAKIYFSQLKRQNGQVLKERLFLVGR
jgi:hypothetical protein